MKGSLATEALVQDAMAAAPGLRVLWVCAPEVARTAVPGQFVMVEGGPGRTTRRPFSVSGVNRERGLIRLLVRMAGPATRWLSTLEPGQWLGLHGPVGQGFVALPGTDRPATGVGGRAEAWVVGGGIGAAPLLFLAAELNRRGQQVWAAVGGRTEADTWGAADLEVRGVEAAVATEDGSAGVRGLVTDLVERRLARRKRHGAGAPPLTLYACGPRGMLVAVARRALAAGLSCQVSVEERMACGVGACAGCTWPDGLLAPGLVLRPLGSPPGTPGEGVGGGPLRICRDGPCFEVVRA